MREKNDRKIMLHINSVHMSAHILLNLLNAIM